MDSRRMQTSTMGYGRTALIAAAALAGVLVQTATGFADQAADEAKAQIGMLYSLQMAPAICQWKDAGDAGKLDAKVVEAEKSLGITEAEKVKFKAQAEAELRKPETCKDGFARSLYDEAIK